MKSYKSVKEQIAKLEKEAENLRQRELKGIIAQVRRTIEQYELTPADLGLGSAPKARGRKAGAKKATRARASIGVAKYRDPATGRTWTGRGRPPTWMIGVKDPSAYLIDGAAAPAKSAAKPAAKKGRPAKAAKKAAPKKAAAKKTRAPKAAKKAAKGAAKKAAPAKANGKAPAPAEGGESNA